MTGFQVHDPSSGARTPLGDFGKSLRDTPLSALSLHAVEASLQRAGITAKDVDHLRTATPHQSITMVCLPAENCDRCRHAHSESPAMGVTRACGTGPGHRFRCSTNCFGPQPSGRRRWGENYSRVPYLAHRVRWGAQRGPFEFIDGLDYIYRCPFTRELMGRHRREHGGTLWLHPTGHGRVGIYEPAACWRCHENGFFGAAIAPIELSGPKGSKHRLFSQDEFPRPEVTLEKLASTTRPFAKMASSVTAGFQRRDRRCRGLGGGQPVLAASAWAFRCKRAWWHLGGGAACPQTSWAAAPVPRHPTLVGASAS